MIVCLSCSCLVSVGDRVVTGQVLCHSGDVGFVPSPHLHIQVKRNERHGELKCFFFFSLVQLHQSNRRDAVTIPFVFETPTGHVFVPQAGKCYTAKGETKK